jgi:hypothetical protein
VIISYPAPQVFWGGFVTTSGGNIIHTFTTSSTLAPITTSVTANYLVVAGGGGASNGGGGAGGYLASTTSLSLASSYTVTVGAGGTGGQADTTNGANGSSSVFNAITTAGGGGGGNGASGGLGLAGGSGGGGGGWDSSSTGGAGNTPSTSPSQGNNGGTGAASGAAGGGGAGAVGSNGSTNTGGAGGAGTASSITGSSVTYAGGGGGRGFSSAGAGGSGGGGAGTTGSGIGSAGTANLGGGGGGSGATNAGGKGGSGVVIISYSGSQLFGGGVVTYNGANTVHTFNTSGTLIPIVSLSASYLIVAGGGGGAKRDGAMGGGGGAGGLLSGSGITIDTNSTYLVTVGSGGAAATSDLAAGGSGTSSSFSIVPTTAIGGGGGGPTNSAGLSGGSGGGGSHASGGGGPGTSGQGNNGGAVSGNIGGGGGGAGAVGTTSGGNGLASSISGTSTTYAGGGGGGGNGVTGGSGGTGGGGAGANGSVGGVAGTANLGGGGGGGGYNTLNPAAGGSGVVIISYAGSSQQMAGGTVTISGGNVIHTFTSSGYLTPLKLVNNSLRFRSSNSAYLSRTPTTAGNRKTWTLSAWVKRGKLGSINTILNANYSTIPWFVVNFGSDDTLQIAATAGSSASWKTAAVFRDPAAWYHVVAVVDTTSATTTITSTSTDRMRLYVNGVQYALTSGTVPTQNSDLQVNNTISHTIGGYSGEYFDGEMAEVNLIDGQALTPYSFGTYNSYGVWQPITYGGSYGTNGFYLPFNASRSSTYAGSFNGTSQYLSVAGFTPNWSTYGDWTAEGWYWINNWSSADPASLFGTGGTGNSIAYIYSSGQIGFGINTVNEFVSPTGLVLSNRWNHVAFVKSGTSLTIYLNGKAVASTSSASTYLSNTSNAFTIARNTAPYYLKGYVSNFRFTNTVVYSGNFTPSTSALTAISGTQLLTCQNSTFIDNSTNAYTITNNGTATTEVQYPFVVTAMYDQGPAGNNWTANGIWGLVGAPSGSQGLYDYMTDVPTLTSATVANYAVWNPLGGPSGGLQGTLSNGNLTWTSPATDQRCVLSTIPLNGDSTGKWYWEVTAVSKTSTYWAIGAFPYNINQYSATSGSTQYRSDGAIFVNGSNVATVASYTTGDVIGITFDASNNQIKYYKNNSLQTTQTVANSAGYGIYAGAGSDSSGSTNVNAINFGQQPFVYTPPTGFLALNTYNI